MNQTKLYSKYIFDKMNQSITLTGHLCIYLITYLPFYLTLNIYIYLSLSIYLYLSILIYDSLYVQLISKGKWTANN